MENHASSRSRKSLNPLLCPQFCEQQGEMNQLGNGIKMAWIVGVAMPVNRGQRRVLLFFLISGSILRLPARTATRTCRFLPGITS